MFVTPRRAVLIEDAAVCVEVFRLNANRNNTSQSENEQCLFKMWRLCAKAQGQNANGNNTTQPEVARKATSLCMSSMHIGPGFEYYVLNAFEIVVSCLV